MAKKINYPDTRKSSPRKGTNAGRPSRYENPQNWSVITEGSDQEFVKSLGLSKTEFTHRAIELAKAKPELFS